MTSTSTITPGSLHHAHSNRETPTHSQTSAAHDHTGNAESGSFEHSSREDTASLSPPGHYFDTPAGSNSALSYYQPSDRSEFEEDPFFGATYSSVDDLPPGFLDEVPLWHSTDLTSEKVDNVERHCAPIGLNANEHLYPLTPERTASLHTASPRSEQQAAGHLPHHQRLPDSISPRELQKPFTRQADTVDHFQFTPSHSSSCQTSDDGLAPPVPLPAAMACPSPQVTVSVWDKDDDGANGQSSTHSLDGSPATVRASSSLAGDLISTGHQSSPASTLRDDSGQWRRHPTTGQAGLDPESRPAGHVPSANEMAKERKIEENNQGVGEWLRTSLDDASVPQEKSAAEIRALEQPRQDDSLDIPFGNSTENQYKPGRMYYSSEGGPLDETDVDLISSQNWGDAPVLHPIRDSTQGRTQPQSSQAAIERFEAMYRDTDSVFSRTATWGTRRRSIGTVDLDLEVERSGNLLKKLSISRAGDKSGKPGNLLKNIQGFLRRPSMSKRSRSREPFPERPPTEDAYIKRDSMSHLRPPSRTLSGKRKSMSNLDTASALISMGQGVASIGGSHARSGSIGADSSAALNRSPRGSLSVRNTLTKRQRSKSELPARSPRSDPKAGSNTNLVDLWRKTGGPPAPIAKTSPDMAQGDEADDDTQDDDMQVQSNIIDGITPNFIGFQQHVLDLNPHLQGTADYLVDRIAHQQVVRYKQLLSMRVNHLKIGPNCPCGPQLCVALGGTAIVQNPKPDAIGRDVLLSQFDEDDEDEDGPLDGRVQQDSFPENIPMPPTEHLPAEFECQLCYARKKLNKPSDWTKHVHEDVQPFTCTWDRCKDPKAFKRKADWVRHENEGHRHLEWWTCDVEDCLHTCFRRDNFLQHLVREHRFPEPRVKTKAALKKAGNSDPTWIKVDQCHELTPVSAHDEACRFCGKRFPTWKKLTVHLAKHMEQISLPVLRLVEAKAKELDKDTIISPVSDPPQRFFPLAEDGNQPAGLHAFGAPGYTVQHEANHGSEMYPMMQQTPAFQQQYYGPQGYGGIGMNLQPPQMGGRVMNTQYPSNEQFQALSSAATSFAPSASGFLPVSNGGDMGSFPDVNGLGLHNVSMETMSHQMGSGMNGPVGYDGRVTPSGSSAGLFSGPGNGTGTATASPYSRSPRHNDDVQNQGWDEGRYSQF